MKERLTSRKFAHLLIVMTILLGLMAYRTWFDGAPAASDSQKNDQICDLSHSPCRATIADSSLTVSLEEQPIRPEHDFQLQLSGVASGVTPIKSWLEGQEMFMGRIPVLFSQQGEGQWQANTQVGACTSHRMVWLLTIEWSNGQRQQMALSVTR
jgi:hypothetical protein